jgi:hypothetical protein
VRLSNLLGVRVQDARGDERVVTDVRMVQDGPILGSFGAALRVDGLVVNRHRFGAHLGIDRAGVRGPGLVKALFRYLQRDAGYVTWDRIRSIEQGVIRIAGSIDELPAAGSSG